MHLHIPQCISCLAFLQQSRRSWISGTIKEIYRGNLLWWPSWCHDIEVINWTSAFFVVEAQSNFLKYELPFPCGLKSHIYIHYCMVNSSDNVYMSRWMITPNPKVWYLHKWRSIWLPSHGINIVQKETSFQIPWPQFMCIRGYTLTIFWQCSLSHSHNHGF